MPQPLVVPADLARSEAFYHSLFDLSPDGVIVADIKGTIVQANPRAAEILEFDSPQELIGSNVIELYVHPEGRAGPVGPGRAEPTAGRMARGIPHAAGENDYRHLLESFDRL